MKLYYLIGKDISESLSPAIHNYIFKSQNINAQYKAQSIGNIQEAEKFLLKTKHKEIHGLNITNPYKIDIIRFLPHLSKHALKIGSVNCVALNQNTKISGYNTDWYGFFQMINIHKINFQDKKIRIIGYGGAAMAVKYALDMIGVADIEIYTRSQNRCNNNKVYHNTYDILQNDDKDNLAIINATPFNFIENDDEFFGYFISRKLIWIDLLYTKLSTEKKEKIGKNRYFNGLDMLIYQALASIDIWFRKNLSKSVDLNDLKLHLRDMNYVK